MKLLRQLGEQHQALIQAGPRGRGSAAEAQFTELFTTKHLFDAAMLEPGLLNVALRFYGFTAQWLTKLACGCDEESDMPDLSARVLPLPTPPPIKFSYLPEHFAEDICEFVLLVLQYSPAALTGAEKSVNTILTLFILLLESPGYVRNPHLRGKFVHLFSMLLPPKPRRGHEDDEQPDFSNLFNLNALSKRYLTAALVRVYVDFENTGSHNQFHDKFPVRARIYDLLEHLCDPGGEREQPDRHPADPAYRASLVAYLSTGELAPKFISLLLSDTIFIFEEAVMNLATSKTLQDEQDSGAWEALPATEVEEKEKALRQAEGTAKHYLGQVCIHVTPSLVCAAGGWLKAAGVGGAGGEDHPLPALCHN
jgi:ubiquitin conjugation factor E4 B